MMVKRWIVQYREQMFRKSKSRKSQNHSVASQKLHENIRKLVKGGIVLHRSG